MFSYVCHDKSAILGGVNLMIYPKPTWALIDHIEKRRVHCEFWQFETGGINLKIYPKSENLSSPAMWCFASQKVFSYYTDISWYLPISSLFQMSSHWPHWKAKSSLWALAVWNWGGVNLPIYPKSENLSSPAIWCFASQKVFSYYTYISLYLPISWLFQMSSHWLHWKSKSSLWALAVWKWGDKSSNLP